MKLFLFDSAGLQFRPKSWELMKWKRYCIYP